MPFPKDRWKLAGPTFLAYTEVLLLAAISVLALILIGSPPFPP